MAPVRAHLRIHGRVQGVFFRASTQAEAEARGLLGWVRNRRDGTVEAVVEGPEVAVRTFVAWCHEGPPAARVDFVDVAWDAPLENLHRFERRPTA